MKRMYGLVECQSGNIRGGLTLGQVEELAQYMDDQQCDMYDITGDLATCPKLIKDLVTHIKELEAKLGS